MYSLKKVEDGLRCGGRNEDEIAIDLKELYLDVLVILILSFGHTVSGKEGREYCMKLRCE